MDKIIKKRDGWCQDSDGSTPRRLTGAGSVWVGKGCRDRMEMILGAGAEDPQLQLSLEIVLVLGKHKDTRSWLLICALFTHSFQGSFQGRTEISWAGPNQKNHV